MSDVHAWLNRFLIVGSGIALVVFVIATVTWPWLSDAFIERMLLPQYEQEFGFRAGRIAGGPGQSEPMLRALLVVTPSGRMAGAGARDRDLIIGGWQELHGAVLAARAGRAAEFRVLAFTDWPDFAKRRTVVLHEGPGPEQSSLTNGGGKVPGSCDTPTGERP